MRAGRKCPEHRLRFRYGGRFMGEQHEPSANEPELSVAHDLGGPRATQAVGGDAEAPKRVIKKVAKKSGPKVGTGKRPAKAAGKKVTKKVASASGAKPGATKKAAATRAATKKVVVKKAAPKKAAPKKAA